MIKCTVCLAENDDFATTCVQCKAFLQDRVPNLNLFETGWKILESPRKAFRVINLAEHKNYGLFLFSLFGISLSFTFFWYFKLGTRFESLLDLIPWAVGVGVAGGVVLALPMTLVYHLVAKLLGGSTNIRGSFALLGYSFTPIALSIFLVLPIELLTFGMYLFTSNPSPYTIKPASYIVLVGFDMLLSVWSIGLAVLGTKVAHRLSIARGTIAVLCTLGLLGGCVFLAAQQLHLVDRL